VDSDATLGKAEPELFERMRQMRVFRDADAGALREALGSLQVWDAEFPKGAVIADAGSRMDAFFCIERGRVQGTRDHADGTLDLVQLSMPGDIVGLDVAASTTRRSPFRFSALEDSSGLCVDFDSLFSDGLPAQTSMCLVSGVMRALANDSIRRLHKVDVLYRRGLRERIAVYLRHMAFMKGDREFVVDLDREQMAQYLGVNRSALSHELAKMAGEGLIAFRKSQFTVLSDALLE